MVLEIRIKNFFSIKEEVILDLRAGTLNTEKSRSLSQNVFDYKDETILKMVAMYGANASGKSNVIKAIRFCHAMVFESHKHNENSRFVYKPFKFKGAAKKPSTYFIRFIANDITYKYSFSLLDSKVLSESLYYYPEGKKAKVFVRDETRGPSKRDIYSFGRSVIKRPYDVTESTSDKTLFISRASQMDREIPKIIFNYFYSSFILRYTGYGSNNIENFIEEYKPNILKALSLADSDIVDFKIRTVREKGKSIKANIETEEIYFEDKELESLEIKTYHKADPNVAFDFMTEESEGTRKLFFLMLAIIEIIKNNKVLLIDEIEDSLHPAIVEYIIQLFNSGQQAQLIFTTHNTNLLDLDKFRKDQIWFVNKNDKAYSELYSLYDYSDFRDTMNLEKAYLQGRFDSIPIVDNSELNIHTVLE